MPSPRGSEAVLGTPALPDIGAFASAVGRLHELSEAAGRPEPPGVVAIPRCLSSTWGEHWVPQRALDEMAALQAAGATAFVVNLPGESVDAFCEGIEKFQQSVLVHLPG